MINWGNKYSKLINSKPFNFNKDYFNISEIRKRASDYVLMILGNNDLERELSNSIASKFNINTNIYDKVIDSVYNSTHIGGSAIHHNLDGAHTFDGVLNILHKHFSNESDFNLILHGFEHLARDLTTPSGINPFLSPSSFLDAKEFFVTQLHISPSLVNDLLNINATELTATVVAIISLLFGLDENKTKRLSELSARFSLVSFFSGNPALLFLSLVVFGQAAVSFYKEKDFASFFDGIMKGTVSTGSFFFAVSLIPGMQFPAIIAGIAASFGANWTYEKTKQFFTSDLNKLFKNIFPYYKSYSERF